MSIRHVSFSSVASMLAACLLPACSETVPQEKLTPNYSGCDTVVEPSANDDEKVQEALINAAADSTVCLAPGTYHFGTELSIAKTGLTLRGQGKDSTILDFSGQKVGGNGLQITSDNITVEAFAVKNTPGDGIRATAVKDVVYRQVAVIWDANESLDNGAYGIYPVSSDGVIVEGCVVKGSRDAGIYVGQSRRVLLVDNEAYGNVAGYELENTIEAEAYNNHAHDNTAGFLIFNLPNLPVQNEGVGRSYVHDNIFENNDLGNFAEPGTMVATVPRGCGMVLLSTDQNEIAKNQIRENDTTGVLILSFNEPLVGKPNDPTFDAYPEKNYIHDNTFLNNGLLPAESVNALVLASPVPDIVSDGCTDPLKTNTMNSLTNCLKNNGNATYASIGACSGFMQTTDISAVTCEHPAVNPERP